MSQKEDYETKADVLENTCCENKWQKREIREQKKRADVFREIHVVKKNDSEKRLGNKAWCLNVMRIVVFKDKNNELRKLSDIIFLLLLEWNYKHNFVFVFVKIAKNFVNSINPPW